MKRIIVATNNAYKADEISHVLGMDGLEFVTMREAGVASDPVEDADTFEGNARIKARSAHEASGGAAVIADDSGLVVDALDGAPGVYSSRFAGEDGNDAANNALLLERLEGVPEAERTARFVCTLVFIDEDGTESVARGTIEGSIGREPRGSEGFGYDPLFLPDEYGGTRALAEVSQAEKNGISHRGNALRVLKKALSQSVDER